MKLNFSNMGQFSQIFNIDLGKSQTTEKQQYRSNTTPSTVEDYYRHAIFISTSDQIWVQLDEQFCKHQNLITDFFVLLSANHSKYL